MVKDTEDLINLSTWTIFHWSFGPIWIGILRFAFKFDWSHPLIQLNWLHLGLWIVFKAVYEITQPPSGYQGKQLDLKGKIVIVTGGSNGLGKKLAKKLSNLGSIIAVIDIVPMLYESNNVYYFKCDLTSPRQIKYCIEDIVTKLGKPTILINNAGTVKTASTFDKVPDEEIEEVLGVNLNAPMHLVRNILPLMIEQGIGHIVNISSLLGHVAPAYLALYASSKAGMIGFHESIRNDLMEYYPTTSIKTTLVMSGKLNTELFGECEHEGYFWMPIQDIERLADKIIDELKVHRNNEIMAPKYAHLMPLFRNFNITFRFWLMNALSFNKIMLNFHKDKKRQ